MFGICHMSGDDLQRAVKQTLFCSLSFFSDGNVNVLVLERIQFLLSSLLCWTKSWGLCFYCTAVVSDGGRAGITLELVNCFLRSGRYLHVCAVCTCSVREMFFVCY